MERSLLLWCIVTTQCFQHYRYKNLKVSGEDFWRIIQRQEHVISLFDIHSSNKAPSLALERALEVLKATKNK